MQLVRSGTRTYVIFADLASVSCTLLIYCILLLQRVCIGADSFGGTTIHAHYEIL